MSFSGGDPTLRESGQTVEATLYEEPPLREGAPAPSCHGLRTFRGLTILEQLATRGAEADIWILQDAGEKCILKLYRHRLEPKIEVLELIREISRAHSNCFVVFRDAGFDETTGRWFELLEYLPLGSLKDVPPEVRRERDFIKNLVAELALAIHCLHENGIIHCDIKPGNVLVRSLDPLDLVLTDFGIASLLAGDVSRKMTTLKGTPMYRAPEAFSRMAGRPGDWWGLGMIVLEHLTEEHPFAGLTDSQIIHRLTIGNVEVPDALDDDWKPLLRGLLTKDDSKRWGHAEVVRWLAGERDIPVHPAYKEETIRPFRFEGKDYPAPADLARAFRGDEQVWRRAVKYAGYLRPWLESNGMEAEAKELEGDDPDVVLARFIYRWERGPFVWLGRVLNLDGLIRLAERERLRQAEEEERKIVTMAGDGSLLELYGLYAGLSGRDDPSLGRLLAFMSRKTAAERDVGFEALLHPERYVWPAGSETGNAEQTLGSLERLQTPPLRRDFLEGLQTAFLLPTELLSLFERASGYAHASPWLKRMQRLELLIPKDGDGKQRLAIEGLNLDDYEKQARVLCWGHTDRTLEKIQESISGLNRLSLASSRLAEFRERKLSERDLLLLGRLYASTRRYFRREKFKVALIALWGAIVGTVFAIFISDYMAAFLCLIYARGFFIFLPPRRQEREDAIEMLSIALIALLLFAIVLSFFILALFGNRCPWLLPGLMGFIQGAISYAVYCEWAARIDLRAIMKNYVALLNDNATLGKLRL